MKWKMKIRLFSLLCWILTLVFFVVLVVWMDKIGDTVALYSTLSFAWIIDILLGCIAFLVFIASFSSSGKQTNKVLEVKDHEHQGNEPVQKKGIHKNPWFYVSMGLLIVVAYLFGKNNQLFLGSRENQPTNTIQPTIIVQPLIDTPTPTVQQKTYIAPTLDSDPPVHCKIHPNCGGGTMPLKQSECASSTCCGFPDGRWVFYKDNAQCDKDQGDNSSSGQSVPVIINQQTANKVPVFLSYGGYTIYCPSQNVGAVMSINSTMESKKSQWATDYNNCADTFFNTDSCYLSCESINNNDLDICRTTYGYTGDNYNACTNQVWDNYSTCIRKCPSSSSACDWVYAEQKSLSSQISNLCK